MWRLPNFSIRLGSDASLALNEDGLPSQYTNGNWGSIHAATRSGPLGRAGTWELGPVQITYSDSTFSRVFPLYRVGIWFFRGPVRGYPHPENFSIFFLDLKIMYKLIFNMILEQVSKQKGREY